MMDEKIINHLIATKRSLEAALANIDMLLQAQLHEMEAQKKTCLHPNKTSMSTMGNIGKWYCPDCKESGQDSTVENEGQTVTMREKEE